MINRKGTKDLMNMLDLEEHVYFLACDTSGYSGRDMLFERKVTISYGEHLNFI